MLFSSRDYGRALAEEEEISIRRWQDMESSRVDDWVTRKASKFAKTGVIEFLFHFIAKVFLDQKRVPTFHVAAGALLNSSGHSTQPGHPPPAFPFRFPPRDATAENPPARPITIFSPGFARATCTPASNTGVHNATTRRSSAR
jgi:hypothetical protein